MAKEFTKIKVETLPNGYSLQVFNNEYMYFNEQELFEGLCYHAGMAIMKENKKELIRETIANLLAGDTMQLMERNQQQQIEIEKLKAHNAKLQDEKTKMKVKLDKLEKRREVYDNTIQRPRDNRP